MRVALGGEACDSTCIPPVEVPSVLTEACFDYFLGAIAPVLPGVDLAIPGKDCWNDLVNSQGFHACVDTQCICTAGRDNPICLTEAPCSAGCALVNMPTSCVNLLNNAVWDALGVLSGGVAFLERVGHAQQILNLFVGAVQCFVSHQ